MLHINIIIEREEEQSRDAKLKKSAHRNHSTLITPVQL